MVHPWVPLSFIQWRIQGRGPGGPPPLFLDQTKAQSVEKNFLETCSPPPLSKDLDDHSPFLSQGLDLALLFTTQTLTIRRLCCHSLQSWQGRGRGGINWNTILFSKYINRHDSFYWQIFHEPLTLDIFMHIKSTFLRRRPVQKNISWDFLHLGDNYY